MATAQNKEKDREGGGERPPGSHDPDFCTPVNARDRRDGCDRCSVRVREPDSPIFRTFTRWSAAPQVRPADETRLRCRTAAQRRRVTRTEYSLPLPHARSIGGGGSCGFRALQGEVGLARLGLSDFTRILPG